MLNNHNKKKLNDNVFEEIKSTEAEMENHFFISGGKDWSRLNYQFMVLSRKTHTIFRETTIRSHLMTL